MSESKGKCYYCKGEVIHSRPHDYGTFTKRIDPKTKKIIIKDVWHSECYYREMKRMQGKEPKEQYKQLTIFDL